MQRDQLPPRPQGPVELSVILPCYNESEEIESLITDWDEALRERTDSYEILIVNDGSTDGTGRILDRLRKENKTLRVIHQLHLGADRAIRRGFESARGKYILQAESDGSVDPRELGQFWDARLEKHLVLGRRTRRIDGFARELASRLQRIAIRLLFKSGLQDPAATFRLFRRDAGLPLVAEIPAGVEGINLALSLLIERRHPGQVAEIPVPVQLKRRVRRQGWLALVARGWQVTGELLKLRLTLATLRISDSSRLALAD